MYDSALRQPARAAHDSMSCAITRGSVTNDTHAMKLLLATPLPSPPSIPVPWNSSHATELLLPSYFSTM